MSCCLVEPTVCVVAIGGAMKSINDYQDTGKSHLSKYIEIKITNIYLEKVIIY